MGESFSYATKTAEGGWRVTGTRVSLDSVVHAYWNGSSPEQIASDFPSLSPDQVREAIAFYLRNRAEIDLYLKDQQARWEQLRKESEEKHGALRDRIRAGKQANPTGGKHGERPRFLTDEDLHGPTIQAVRRLEPLLEIVRAFDVGLSHVDDSLVLEYATTNGFLVVSHDVSTMKAAAERRIASGLGISGFFLVPQGRAIREVAESLVLIWAGSQAEEWRDHIE